LLASLIGAIAGSMTGGQLGQVVDEQYLGNWQCLDCDGIFRANPVPKLPE
jgi:hypothetical protein